MVSADPLPTPVDQPRHPIQVVSRRAGLSADVVRIWERRYGAVSPQRDGHGRRVYSDGDIERLTLLRRATAPGRRISDVIALSAGELKELVAADEAASLPQVFRSDSAVFGQARVHLDACMAAVHEVNPNRLQRALSQARTMLAIPVLLEEVVSALLREVGKNWQKGSMRVFQEHMTVAVVRSFLGDLLNSSHSGASGPALLVTTPAGQYHEIGALIAAVYAASQGWTIIHLGPATPAVEIAAAAARTCAKVVALSIVYPGDDSALPDELRKLRRLLAPEIMLIVGGRAVAGYRAVLDEIGARYLSSPGELQAVLDGLRSAPHSA